MYGLPTDYLQTYRDRVQAVTIADIARVAQKYITPQHVAIVIVGDAAAIREQIEPYTSNIELYNAMGARQAAAQTRLSTISTESSAH